MSDETRRLAHQLNNLMSPAMMMAETLSEHADPAVRRAGKVILESLDKMVAAVRESRAKPPTA